MDDHLLQSAAARLDSGSGNELEGTYGPGKAHSLVQTAIE
jgi:hypothetical protein